jgi:hypothetical protein
MNSEESSEFSLQNEKQEEEDNRTQNERENPANRGNDEIRLFSHSATFIIESTFTQLSSPYFLVILK